MFEPSLKAHLFGRGDVNPNPVPIKVLRELPSTYKVL
jgi:hypothetical protein